MDATLLERLPQLGGLVYYDLLRGGHALSFGIALFMVGLGHYVLRSPDRAITAQQEVHLRHITYATAVFLGLLWFTGFFMTIDGAAKDPAYWHNAKLLAKVGVVTIATINGVIMHWWVFPKVKAGVVLAELPVGFQLKAAFLGALSLASWSWASLLGVARNWNHFVSFGEIFALYGVTILLIYLIAVWSIKNKVVIRQTFYFKIGGRRGSVEIRIPVPERRPARARISSAAPQAQLTGINAQDSVPLERPTAKETTSALERDATLRRQFRPRSRDTD